MPTPAYSQYINKYTTPNGTEYWLRDEEARELIETIAGGSIRWVGVTTTPINDGSHTPTSISVNGTTHSVAAGDIAGYQPTGGQMTEYIYTGDPGTDGLWQKFGDFDPSVLGALAFQDDASGSYTPAGSVSTPTISVATAGATDTAIKAINTVVPGGTAPSNPIVICDVVDHTLRMYQIGHTDATVKTGDASYSASQPTFTGTQGTITVS